jgi:hypothetical protein
MTWLVNPNPRLAPRKNMASKARESELRNGVNYTGRMGSRIVDYALAIVRDRYTQRE